jgi:hypothetical protein
MSQTPIKIPILTANPSGTTHLRLDQEVREIEIELLMAKSRGSFKLISKWAARVDDLARALLNYSSQIIHFSRHRSGDEGLTLEDDNGKLQFVKTETLARLFKLAHKAVQCVIPIASYSQVQAAAIYQHIGCVVGMNKAIGDKAAIQFSTKFYQALAAGRSFQYAYDFACTVLDLSGNSEFGTPTLLNRNEEANPFAIAAPTSDPHPVAPEQPASPPVRQSQSIGNITISGNNNPFAATQAGRDVTINQSSDRTQVTNTRLQAALAAVAQLKQAIASSPDLNPIEKATVEVPAKMLESELQKPQPDKSLVELAIAALKKEMDRVATLAEPVTKVATLVAKAWVKLP